MTGSLALSSIGTKIGLALSAAGLLLPALVSSAQASGSPTASYETSERRIAPRSEVALTWSPAYMVNNHDFTEQEARAVARRFDVVVAMPVAFKRFADVMRKENPKLTLLSYANGTKLSFDKAKNSGLPERAYSHDKNGNRIRMPAWDSWLMEASDPAWRQAAVKECRRRVKEGSYDGCLVDNMTLGVFSGNSVDAIPANPITGEPYTEKQYRGQLISLGRYFANQSPELVHLYNALTNQWRYWVASVKSRRLGLRLPGSQMEDFLRGASTRADDFPDTDAWLRNVRVIKDLEAAGKTGLFSTKVWASASRTQVAKWQRYSMASFLMAANGRSYYAFTPSRDRAGATGVSSPYRMPSMGEALGTMTTYGSGGWYRRFEQGVAVVNPGSKPVTFRFAEPMRTLSGEQVKSVTVAPKDGQVLIGRPKVVS